MSGVRLTRHHLPRTLGRDWGRVVFVSSDSAIFIPPEMIHYGFSKAAQLAIARGAAELTRGSRVTVNSVLPGPTGVEAKAGRAEIGSESWRERVGQVVLISVDAVSFTLQRKHITNRSIV